MAPSGWRGCWIIITRGHWDSLGLRHEGARGLWGRTSPARNIGARVRTGRSAADRNAARIQIQAGGAQAPARICGKKKKLLEVRNNLRGHGARCFSPFILFLYYKFGFVFSPRCARWVERRVHSKARPVLDFNEIVFRYSRYL